MVWEFLGNWQKKGGIEKKEGKALYTRDSGAKKEKKFLKKVKKLLKNC